MSTVASNILRSTQSRGHLRGFTLVEMIAVLAIVGLLASAVVVSLRGVSRPAREREAVERLIATDARARDHARRFRRPSQLVVDLGDPSRLYNLDTQTQEPVGTGTTLGAGMHLSCLKLQDQTITSGQVALPCSSRGQTPSYGLAIDRPAAPASRGSAPTSGGVSPPSGGGGRGPTWLLVIGATGEVVHLQSEQEIDAFFALTTPTRPDAR